MSIRCNKLNENAWNFTQNFCMSITMDRMYYWLGTKYEKVEVERLGSIKTKSSTMKSSPKELPVEDETTCRCYVEPRLLNVSIPHAGFGLLSTRELLYIHLLLFFGLFHFRSYRNWSSKWNTMIMFSFISCDEGIRILRCSFDIFACFAFETSTSIVTSARWKLKWDQPGKNI